MTRTYYVVQTGRDEYAQGDGIIGFVAARGVECAARLCFGRARRVLREFMDARTADCPRRFPRIVKVTVETKTITPRIRRARTP